MLRSLLVITLLGAGFLGALWSRHIALLTYVWLALFRPVEWIWWDISAIRPSLLAGLLLVLPCLVTGQFPSVSHPIVFGTWFFAGLVLLAQISSYVATDWAYVDQFARLVVVCGFALTILNTRQRLIQYVAVMAGSLAFFSAKAGLVSMLAGGSLFAAGQAGSFIDNNGYALAIAMAMPLMAASAQNLRFGRSFDRFIRWGFIAAVPLSVFAVIGTMSRGGLVAVGALTIVFALLQRRPVVWTIGVIVAGFLTMRYAPMPEGYLDRIETITTYDEVEETSAIGRLHFWRVAGAIARSHPLGVGARQFERAYDDFDFSEGAFGRNRAVHSSHFQVLAEVGYLGFAVWLSLFAYAFSICLRIRFGAKRLAQMTEEDRRFYVSTATAFAASMFAFIVGGSFLSMAFNDLTWLTFMGVAAMHRQFTAQRASLNRMALIVRAAPVRPRRAAVA